MIAPVPADPVIPEVPAEAAPDVLVPTAMVHARDLVPLPPISGEKSA